MPNPNLQANVSTFLIVWLLAFLVPSGLANPAIPDKGEPAGYIVNFDCTGSFWARYGLISLGYRPFSNHTFLFRCPTNCRGVQVLNPYAIGPLEVDYLPLAIGNHFFCGESFICSLAIHSGIIDNERGGFGRVTLLGQRQGFTSLKKHGIISSYILRFPFSTIL